MYTESMECDSEDGEEEPERADVPVESTVSYDSNEDRREWADDHRQDRQDRRAMLERQLIERQAQILLRFSIDNPNWQPEDVPATPEVESPDHYRAPQSPGAE